jgi:hypothetical protein
MDNADTLLLVMTTTLAQLTLAQTTNVFINQRSATTVMPALLILATKQPDASTLQFLATIEMNAPLILAMLSSDVSTRKRNATMETSAPLTLAVTENASMLSNLVTTTMHVLKTLVIVRLVTAITLQSS